MNHQIETIMKTLTINSHREFKKFIKANRESITNINGLVCRPLYPMIQSSNKHATYYDVASQSDKGLYPPFNITLN